MNAGQAHGVKLRFAKASLRLKLIPSLSTPEKECCSAIECLGWKRPETQCSSTICQSLEKATKGE
jgi:hypothetical protein